MTKQEYKHIRNLAWDLLIDAKISKLPTDIKAIATLYDLQSLVDDTKSLYSNTLLISKNILKIFGLTKPEFVKHLTIRILAPLIVFKELDIKSSDEIHILSKLPMNLSIQRFNRYKMLLKRNSFGISHLETMVLSNFQSWINQTKKKF